MLGIWNGIVFWKILGLGIAIPTSVVVAITLLAQMTAKGQYEADLTKSFKLYILALLGWAIFFGVR